jgi:hypothetical protein
MESIQYTNVNEKVIKDYAKLYYESSIIGIYQEPNLKEGSSRLHPHLLTHSDSLTIKLGISREAHKLFEEERIKHAALFTTTKDIEFARLIITRQFDFIFSQNKLAQELKPEDVDKFLTETTTFELDFDCQLGLLRKAFDKSYLINKQIPQIIGYYLNCWDENGDIILLKKGLEVSAGKIGFQNIIILASLIKDNSKLKDLINQIVSIDLYKEQIGIVAQNELSTNKYRSQINNWVPDKDSKTPYSPKDLKIIRNQYQNPSHANSYSRRIEKDAKRILQII